MYRFSKHSIHQLSTCDEKLIRLFNTVIKIIDCKVVEGHRSIEQQRKLFEEGYSKTMNSKHALVPSLAVDVYPYPIPEFNPDTNLKDYIRYYYFAGIVKGVASQLNINIRCGADWDSDNFFIDQHFDDLVHFELI